MEEAAQNLGCTGLRRFWKITLPLIQPGLFAGGTIVFIWVFTELGTPLIFDYSRVTSVQIFNGLRDIGGNPFPYALVAVMLAASILIYGVGKGIFGQTGHAMVAKATSVGGARALPAARAWLCTAIFCGVTLVAVLPHMAVVLIASSRDWYASLLPREFTLGNYRAALGHELTVPAIANSLKFASLSTVIDVILGIAIAYVVVRTRIAGRHVLDFLSMLPLAVPGVVLAFGYLAMSQEGRLFSFINPVRNPSVLLVIAYSVRRLPYVVRSAAAGFQQTSVALEEAAESLGEPPAQGGDQGHPAPDRGQPAGRRGPRVRVRNARGERLHHPRAEDGLFPITKAILELFQLLGDGKFLACALGVWAMVFLGTMVAGASMLLGKRLGAIFRV